MYNSTINSYGDNYINIIFEMPYDINYVVLMMQNDSYDLLCS